MEVIKCQIIENDVTKLKNFSEILNSKFNLVFLDPPFKDENINLIIELIYDMKILDKKALIIIHRNREIKEKYHKKLNELRIENYGKSKIIFSQLVD